MDDRRISNSALSAFRAELVNQEKSTATVEKYCRDVRYFALYVGAMRPLTLAPTMRLPTAEWIL